MEGDHPVWYINRGGQQYGPLTNTELLQLQEDRRLLATDYVWQTGMTDWVQLEALENNGTFRAGYPAREPQSLAFDASKLKYRAFLSYAHSDEHLAKWLHRSLETFKVDKDLIGRDTSLGPVPSQLGPVFRDRDEFQAGKELSTATQLALDISACLVVLCSPAAAHRHAVNEEVRLFKERHPERPVIPVIVSGRYPDSYPPALRFAVSRDGRITTQEVVILAPDLRDEADGRQLGLSKIVSAMLGLPVDEIHKRAERHLRRTTRIRNGVIATLAVLTILATTSAVIAWHQLKTNTDLLEATLTTATQVVTEAVSQAESYKIPRVATLTILKTAEALFGNMAKHGTQSTRTDVQRARMLIEFSKCYEMLGQSELQLSKASEAVGIMTEQLRLDRSNKDAAFLLATAKISVADALRDRGMLAEAEASYQVALKMFREQFSVNPGVGHNLVVTLSKLVDVHLSTGDSNKSYNLLISYLPTLESLSTEKPREIEFLDHLSVAYVQLGDILKFRAAHREALVYYDKALSIDRRRVAIARTPDRHAAIAVKLERIGDIQGLTGEYIASIENYKGANAIMEQLARQYDTENTHWIAGIAIGLGRIGDNYLVMGEFENAMQSYAEGLRHSMSLAQRDIENSSNSYMMAMDRFRVALAMQLSQAGNREQALKLAKSLYMLKYTLSPVELKRFENITVEVFRAGKPTDEVKSHLRAAALVLRRFQTAGRLDAIATGYANAVFAAEESTR